MNEDSVMEELRQSRDIDVGSRWAEMGSFGEFVHNGENSVETSGGLGQLGNKVHGNTIPSLHRDFKGLQQTKGASMARLGALARRARADVGLDVSGKPGPIKRGRYCLHRLADAKVSIDSGVAVLSENPLLEGRHVWDVELPWLFGKSPVKEPVVEGVVRGSAGGNGSHNWGGVRVRIVGLFNRCHKVGIDGKEGYGGEVGATT
jgi:hypothetical protein